MIKVILLDFFGVLWLEDGLNMPLLKEVQELQGEYDFMILSNMGRGGFDDRIPTEYQELFSKIFLSGETGYLKPHPEAFQQVIDYAQVEASEILFLDDYGANVEAAQDAGMASRVYAGRSLFDTINELVE